MTVPSPASERRAASWPAVSAAPMVMIGMLVTNMRMLIQIASAASLRPRIKPESGDRNFMRTSLLGGAAIVFMRTSSSGLLFLA